MRRFVCLVAALAILGSVGCGGGGPTLYKVSGKVTLDGEPLEGASVTFNDITNTLPRMPSGETDANGEYKLYYPQSNDGDPSEGAPAGEYWVAIRKVPKDEEAEGDEPEFSADTAEDMMKNMAKMGGESRQSKTEKKEESEIPLKYGARGPDNPYTKVTIEEKSEPQVMQTFELTRDKK